jgi:hypothetical protein
MTDRDRIRGVLAVLAGVTVLVADCGGGGSSPGVASVDGSLQDELKFSDGMRANGVPSFSEPNGQGAIGFSPSSGVNPSSPEFETA